MVYFRNWYPNKIYIYILQIICFQANLSVINLDETLNETLKIEDDNLSPIKNNPDDSVIEVPILLSGGDMHFHRPFITTKTRKTLLTTSLSGVKLAPRVNDLVSIFSDIIPNSAVKTRLLISENKLCQLAVEEGFTNIIIINMLLANPIGLYLIDFLKNIKIKVGFSSYKCLDYEKLVFKAKTPPIVVKSFGKLNEFQESTVQFFSEICETNCKQINAEKINFECYDSHIEFTYNLAGLHFSLMSSNYNDDDSKEIYFKEIH